MLSEAFFRIFVLVKHISNLAAPFAAFAVIIEINLDTMQPGIFLAHSLFSCISDPAGNFFSIVYCEVFLDQYFSLLLLLILIIFEYFVRPVNCEQNRCISLECFARILRKDTVVNFARKQSTYFSSIFSRAVERVEFCWNYCNKNMLNHSRFLA